MQPGGSARAILYQAGDDQLIDLGNPSLDQVNARGARLGDRLCVYELSAQRLGCETITAGNEELALVSKPGWQPDVLVSPVTSRTINLYVNIAGLPSSATLRARLYSIDGSASPTITLSPIPLFQVHLPLVIRMSSTSTEVAPTESSGSDTVTALRRYTGTFTLAEPAPQGLVQVWVEEGGYGVRPSQITHWAAARRSVMDAALSAMGAERLGMDAARLPNHPMDRW